jgi:K+-sensing histidine kinase KdpD
MAGRRVSARIAGWLRGVVASAALLASVTVVVALLRPHVPVLSLLVLYLLAILPVAVVWGARLAALTSIVATGIFAFFLPPTGSIQVADVGNVAALAVFLLTSVVVAELSARARRSARESARLSEEQSR